MSDSSSSSSSSLLDSTDGDGESLPNTADVSTDEDEGGMSSSSSSSSSASTNNEADEDSITSGKTSTGSSSNGEENDESNSSSNSSSSHSTNSSSSSGSATSASHTDNQELQEETSHSTATDAEQDSTETSVDEDPTEAEDSVTQTEEASDTEAEQEVTDSDAEEEASETEAEEASETEVDEASEAEAEEASETEAEEASETEVEEESETEAEEESETEVDEASETEAEETTDGAEQTETEVEEDESGTREASDTEEASAETVTENSNGEDATAIEVSEEGAEESDEKTDSEGESEEDSDEQTATSESDTVLTEIISSPLQRKPTIGPGTRGSLQMPGLAAINDVSNSANDDAQSCDEKSASSNEVDLSDSTKSGPERDESSSSAESSANTKGSDESSSREVSSSHSETMNATKPSANTPNETFSTKKEEKSQLTPLDDDFFSISDSKTAQPDQRNIDEKTLQNSFVVSPTKSKASIIHGQGDKDLPPLVSPLVRHMDKEAKASDELERRQGMMDKMELKSLGDMSELTIDTTVRQALGSEGVGRALEKNPSNLISIVEDMPVAEGDLDLAGFQDPIADTPQTFHTPTPTTNTEVANDFNQTQTPANISKPTYEDPKVQHEEDKTKSFRKKSGIFSRIKRGISNVRPSFRQKQFSNPDEVRATPFVAAGDSATEERVETPNVERSIKSGTQNAPVHEVPTTRKSDAYGRADSFDDTAKIRSSSFDSNEGVDRKKRFGFFRRGNIQRNYSSFDEESSSILAQDESPNGNMMLERYGRIESNSKIQAASFTPAQVDILSDAFTENQFESNILHSTSLDDLNVMVTKEQRVLNFDSEQTGSVTPAFDSSFVGKDEISYVTDNDGPVFQDFGFESPFSEDVFSSGKRTHLGTKKSTAGKIEQSKRDAIKRAVVEDSRTVKNHGQEKFSSFDASSGDESEDKNASLVDVREKSSTASFDDSVDDASGVESDDVEVNSSLSATDESGGTRHGSRESSVSPRAVEASRGDKSDVQGGSASGSSSLENGEESVSASTFSDENSSGGGTEVEDESENSTSEVSAEEDGLATGENGLMAGDDFTTELEDLSASSSQHSADASDSDDLISTVEEDTQENLSLADMDPSDEDEESDDLESNGDEESDDLEFIEVSDFVSVNTDRRREVDNEETATTTIGIVEDSDQDESPKQQDLFTGFPLPNSAGVIKDTEIGLVDALDDRSNDSNQDVWSDTKSMVDEEYDTYVNQDMGPDLWKDVVSPGTDYGKSHGTAPNNSFQVQGGSLRGNVDVVNTEQLEHEEAPGVQETEGLNSSHTIECNTTTENLLHSNSDEHVNDHVNVSVVHEEEPVFPDGSVETYLFISKEALTVNTEANDPTTEAYEVPVSDETRDLGANSAQAGNSENTVAESFRSNESSKASDASSKSRKSASRSIFGRSLKPTKDSECNEDSDGEHNLHNPIMAFASRAKKRLVEKNNFAIEGEIPKEKSPKNEESMAYYAEEIEEDLSECHGTTDAEDIHDCSNSLADHPGGPNQSIGFDENGIQASLFHESVEIDDDYTYSKEELDIPTTSGHGLPPLPRPVASMPNQSIGNSRDHSPISASTNESNWEQHKPRRGRRPQPSCSNSFNETKAIPTILPTVRVQQMHHGLDDSENGGNPQNKVIEEEGTGRKSANKKRSNAHPKKLANSRGQDHQENDEDSAYHMENAKPNKGLSWFKTDSAPNNGSTQNRRQKTKQRLELPPGNDEIDSLPYSTKKPTRHRPICIGCALMLMAIVGITAGIALGLLLRYHSNSSKVSGNTATMDDSIRNEQTHSPSTQPTVGHPPTQSPVQFQDLYEILCSNLADCRVLLVQDAAQGKAFQWMSESGIYKEQTEEEIVNRFALATVYFSTGGADWLQQEGWLSEDTVCSWFSTSRSPCDSDGTFHALELDNNNLDGTLPTEIGLLSTLTSLSFRNPANKRPAISGNLPANLGDLKDLELLRLSGNQISGFLPFELGTLANLRLLDISRNNIEGDIPFTFDGMTGLEEFNVEHNSFTGAVPGRFLQRATSLRDMILDDNKFSSFPAKSGSLRNLRRLSVARNDLANFPTLLLELNELEKLDLSGNGFDGTIPTMIGSMQGLQELRLSSNLLTGSIPRSIGTLINLQESLDLSSNRLTGSIPVEITNLGRLKRLYVNANELSGSIPSEMVRLNQINVLRLDENKLSGEVSILLCDLYDFTRALTYADCGEIRGAETCFTYCCDEATGCTCRFETSSSSNDFLRCVK